MGFDTQAHQTWDDMNNYLWFQQGPTSDIYQQKYGKWFKQAGQAAQNIDKMPGYFSGYNQRAGEQQNQFARYGAGMSGASNNAQNQLMAQAAQDAAKIQAQLKLAKSQQLGNLANSAFGNQASMQSQLLQGTAGKSNVDMQRQAMANQQQAAQDQMYVDIGQTVASLAMAPMMGGGAPPLGPGGSGIFGFQNNGDNWQWTNPYTGYVRSIG
jgi:hypothetical protein